MLNSFSGCFYETEMKGGESGAEQNYFIISII